MYVDVLTYIYSPESIHLHIYINVICRCVIFFTCNSTIVGAYMLSPTSMGNRRCVEVEAEADDDNDDDDDDDADHDDGDDDEDVENDDAKVGTMLSW